MNDSMSLGIHRLWKDDFVSSMLPRLPSSIHRNPARPGIAPAPEAPNQTFKCLDVAGGTGDIALRILDRAREKFGSRDIEVEVVDLNQDMLHEGRKRVAQTMYYNSEFGEREARAPSRTPGDGAGAGACACPQGKEQ